jgi:plasmid stabilization system protein ParE
MKIVYLSSTLEDLEWMRSYYTKVFPDGAIRAREQFKATVNLICEHPSIGHETDIQDVLEFTIPKTPFSVIYREKDDCIEVLRIWDDRGDPKGKSF